MILSSLFDRLKQHFIPKEKFKCSVCEGIVNKFLPLDSYYSINASKYGYKYFGQGETINLENYLCPLCGATDRERLYALYLNKYAYSEYVKSSPQYRPILLHFAPDKALANKLKKDNLFNYRSVDLLMQGVDDTLDITDLRAYENSSFDCLICSHVLEHVIDDRKAISELYRILKRGGWGIIMVPIIPALDKTIEDHSKITEADRWRYFGQGDHVRLYAKYDFISLMKQAGFQVEQYGVNCFGDDCFKKHAISSQSVLYVVKK